MDTITTRAQLNTADTWNLGDLFSSLADWETAFASAKTAVGALDALPGTLTHGAEALQAGLDAIFSCGLLCGQLYVYAHMLRDEDNAVEASQAVAERAELLNIAFDAATAFVNPEILTLDEKTVTAWQAQTPGLAPYAMFLKDIFIEAPHTLSTAEEKLLAQTQEMAAVPKTAFTLLETLDLSFPELEIDGTLQRLTHARYGEWMEHPDRDVRRQAYEAYYDTFAKHRNTLGALYAGSVKNDSFYAKARNHKGSLAHALHGDRVPGAVYSSLIDAVEQALPALHRYIALKGRVLGVQPQMYDLYVPLVQDFGAAVDYPEATRMVLEACRPLGADYTQTLQTAFANRWVDVYETPNKTTGAYSWGAYGSHPYVLMNYRPQLDGAFTLAHEMGHALHSHYSNANNPYPCAQYNIMAAEVASTVNEMLLLDFLLAKQEAAPIPTDPAERQAHGTRRIYLLNHFLECVRTTVIRQTMFASFERTVHARAEADEAVTHDWLCGEYAALNARYQGFAADERIPLEWARIPHFYNAFYVYKYATGFSAAVAIAQGIRKTGDCQGYLRFLRSGGSMDALDCLKLAGVDLTRPDPVAACLAAFEQRVGELETALGEGTVP